jgi:hypothetical protein
MKANVGSIDRGLRIAAGIVILALYFFLEPGVRLFALLGFIPLLTGLARWCPLYTLLGVRTCRMQTAPGGKNLSRKTGEGLR